MRYLLLIFAIWVGAMIIRHFLRNPGNHNPRSEPTPAQPMARCSYCGVHFPKSEAIIEGEKIFCSTEHRDAQKK